MIDEFMKKFEENKCLEEIETKYLNYFKNL
jgi:hypothetical protein